jgi:hypothetical protein
MDFGGPMFGVFSAAERQAFLDWIESPAPPPITRLPPFLAMRNRT